MRLPLFEDIHNLSEILYGPLDLHIRSVKVTVNFQTSTLGFQSDRESWCLNILKEMRFNNGNKNCQKEQTKNIQKTHQTFTKGPVDGGIKVVYSSLYNVNSM